MKNWPSSVRKPLSCIGLILFWSKLTDFPHFSYLPGLSPFGRVERHDLLVLLHEGGGQPRVLRDARLGQKPDTQTEDKQLQGERERERERKDETLLSNLFPDRLERRPRGLCPCQGQGRSSPRFPRDDLRKAREVDREPRRGHQGRKEAGSGTSNGSQVRESQSSAYTFPIFSKSHFFPFRHMASPNVEYLGVMAWAAQFQWIEGRTDPSDAVEVQCGNNKLRIGEEVRTDKICMFNCGSPAYHRACLTGISTI